MSKSDAQRESYLRDGMTLGERVEVLERRLNEIDDAGEDDQYFHDVLRSLGRRVADLESSGTTRGPVRYLDPAGNIVDKGDSRRAPSPTECGRIVVDAGEWDRLMRIREAAKTVVATIDSCKGWSEYHVTFASLREALKP